MESVFNLRFKLNISYILVEVKWLYLTRFREAYIHKERKNKEEIEVESMEGFFTIPS